MKQAVIIVAALLATSCATTDYFVADGNRSAGTVTLVCNYDMFTSCPSEPSAEQRQAAAQACARWGYIGAQAFGSVRDITEPDYTGRLEMPFQCLSHLEE